MNSGTGLMPINLGLEQIDLVGRLVEIQTVQVTNLGKNNEREARRHDVGRLVGFTDKFENDEIYNTTFYLEGAGSYTHRVIEINWFSGTDPDRQLIQPLDVKP